MKHLFRNTSQIEQGETFLKMNEVSKSFADQPIIDDINLTVKKGEFVVVTGPSGSGKSTILRTIAGLERPDSGTVTLLGNDLYGMKQSHRSKLIAKNLGVGFQSHNLDTGHTVLNNLESLAEAKGMLEERYLGHIATLFGLSDRIDSKNPKSRETVMSLSGGEKQRVALGRLLVPRPELVLLDEPTASIDPHGKAAIYETLRTLNEEEGTTFIVVSHDEVARHYSDREIVVDTGHIVADRPITPTPISPAA